MLLFVCTFCVQTYASCQDKRRAWGVLPYCLLPYPWDRVSPWTWGSLFCLGWLASESLKSAYLCPQHCIIYIYNCAWTFWDLFLFNYVYLCVFLWIYVMRVGACRGQKRALEPLYLELHYYGPADMDTGDQGWALWKRSTEPSLQSATSSFLKTRCPI